MYTCRICVIRIFVGFPEKSPHPMLSPSDCSFCSVTNNTCSPVILFLSIPRFPITRVIHAGSPNLPGRFSGAELKIAPPVLFPVCPWCPRSMHALNDCRWECLMFQAVLSSVSLPRCHQCLATASQLDQQIHHMFSELSYGSSTTLPSSFSRSENQIKSSQVSSVFFPGSFYTIDLGYGH